MKRRGRAARRGRTALAAALPLLLGSGLGCEDVSVNPLLVAEVRVEPDAATLTVGETRTFAAHVFDAAGRELKDRSVVWGTDAPNVVHVTEEGAALGLRPGAARITAIAGGTSGDAELIVVFRDLRKRGR